VVVFEELGFPAIDNAYIPTALLHKAFPAARFASANELSADLSDKHTTLLVLPYGSAFPEEQWRDIRDFLLRGGNLLTLGGRPFTRPVLLEDGQLRTLPETFAFARQLLISDYQETPGSSDAAPEVNPDEPVDRLGELRWRRAYSIVVRLSQEETSNRIGTSGTFDAELKTLLWGVSRGNRAAAPAVELDHFQNDYTGSRWIMLNCQMDSTFLENPQADLVIAALAHQANRGAELLRVTPSYPLYLPEESWQLELQWNRFQQAAVPSKALITISHDGHQEVVRTVDLEINSYPIDETITLPASGQTGFHTVEIRLNCGDSPCGSIIPASGYEIEPIFILVRTSQSTQITFASMGNASK
jgi:hypothetical protein